MRPSSRFYYSFGS